MIIDIGGGTAEMAVISLGGVVASTSVRVGGNSSTLRSLNISARNIIWRLANARPKNQDQYRLRLVYGRQIASGNPRARYRDRPAAQHYGFKRDVTEAIQNELKQ
jgi:rod shape-determining protein MreB